MKEIFHLSLLTVLLTISYQHNIYAQTKIKSGTTVTSLTIKYDVDIVFAGIKCLKVVEPPFDTQEDIYGVIVMSAIRFTSEYKGSQKELGRLFYPPFDNSDEIVTAFFSRKKDWPLQLGLNQMRQYSNKYTFENYTYDDMLALRFTLGGIIFDKDIIDAKYQNCVECGDTYRWVELRDFKSQIDALEYNTPKFLKIGSDEYLELNFFESDMNSSHIKVLFKIKITKKS